MHFRLCQPALYNSTSSLGLLAGQVKNMTKFWSKEFAQLDKMTEYFKYLKGFCILGFIHEKRLLDPGEATSIHSNFSYNFFCIFIVSLKEELFCNLIPDDGNTKQNHEDI